jgi:GntR family transcriptional regulator/MocR family aminotransferase
MKNPVPVDGSNETKTIKQRSTNEMLYLNIQKEPGSFLMKQIYEQIRFRILKGELTAGQKLSSIREMSQVLNVSRNTIMEAYEMLMAEGYVTSVPGSGFFVAQGAEFSDAPSKISDYQMTAFASGKLEEGTIGFHSGTPALDFFPRSKWNKIASRTFNEAPVSALGYDDPQGRTELRDTLASYLKKTAVFIAIRIKLSSQPVRSRDYH